MEKGLVSIITPCFNGEKYLKRYFDSLLDQTYKKIQIIFINDGSKDETEKIAFKYKEIFSKQNIDYTYIYQKNSGQASAINNGLKYVKGEFLIWPDSDDYYENNAIEEMVKPLLNDKNISYVRCGVAFRNEDDLSLIKVCKPFDIYKENLFADYLMKTNNVHCFSGVIMIRFAEFLKYNNGTNIYLSKEGQNWQLILLIAYKGVAKYVDKNLYNCLVRKDSHSRIARNSLNQIKRNHGFSKLITNTLKKIKMPTREKLKYILIIKKKYIKENIKIKYNDLINSRKIENKSSNKNLVLDSNKCNGCMACKNICPQESISIYTDKEGFEFPTIDDKKCTNCNLCRKTCPVINNNSYLEKPIKAFACYNKDESGRMSSSSGGVFELLANYIIDKKGVVFGPSFDKDYFLVHDYCQNKKDIIKFKGSKYVQSSINSILKEVKRFLEEERYVLFTGTPCQIGGLKAYLKKDYDKLYTQDIICHGVPSKKLLNKYLNFISKGEKIDYLNFRNKDFGWQNFSFKIKYGNNIHNKINKEDIYMNLFKKNKCLRYSCYNCEFKSRKCSDITLGDFWGIDNVIEGFNDDKGVSLLIVNSQKGYDLFDFIKSNLKYKEVNFGEAIKYNSSYFESPKMPIKRDRFYFDLDKLSFKKIYNIYMKNNANIFSKIFNKIKNIVRSK